MKMRWLIALQACAGVGDDTCDARFDGDEDGYDDCADCAPDDPSISPGAEEFCNGVDDDCDGTVDEEPVDAMPETCNGLDDDCNGLVDDDPVDAVPETCNGLDDDCDGAIDEDASDATWYVDGDDDGWGDPASTPVCAQMPGRVDRAGDCDDGFDAVHPEAAERWNDRDDDCDGTVDRGPIEGATDGWVHGERFHAIGTQDSFGWGGDLLDDGGQALVVTSRTPGTEISQAWIAPAAIVDRPRRALASAYTARITKPSCPVLDADCGHLVFVAAPFLDLTDDGVPDLVLASHRLDLGGPGETLLFAGGEPLAGELASADRATVVVPYMANLLTPTGPRRPLVADLTGDGAAEVVSARALDEVPNVFEDPRNGSALVFEGPLCDPDCPATVGLGDLLLRVWGERGQALGSAVAAADVDGDGIDDLVLGAPQRGDGGAVVVIAGGDALGDHASVPETGPGVTVRDWRGETGQRIGSEVRALAAGMAGADAYAEVVAGAANVPVVWVWRGVAGTAGRRDDVVSLTAQGDGRAPGVSACVVPGWVVVGDPGWGDGRGAIHAFRDATLADAGTLDLDADADAIWTGSHEGDRLGAGLSCADVDGDGRAELLIGATGWDLDGVTGDHGALFRVSAP